GLSHPVSGLDNILVMVAVGIFAATLGGRALWLVPAAFVAAMVAGGLLGYSGVAVPLVEPAIAISVLAMGLAIAIGLKLPTAAAMGLVAVFALFHGHAHGSEGAALASFAPYATGFVVATAALHIAGIGLGVGLDRIGTARGTWLRGAMGAAGALAGIMLLVG
ncbi:MAG: HupE/UreJ family protein, partial [Hyphomicrobiaceae bacterium]